MMIKGVACTILVLGKVQIGTIHNDQRELLIEELFLRGIVVDPKEKIKVLKEKITSNECQNQVVDSETKKYFLCRLHAATDWSKDMCYETIAKITELRAQRNA